MNLGTNYKVKILALATWTYFGTTACGTNILEGYYNDVIKIR